jgi:hypothetical protein
MSPGVLLLLGLALYATIAVAVLLGLRHERRNRERFVREREPSPTLLGAAHTGAVSRLLSALGPGGAPDAALTEALIATGRAPTAPDRVGPVLAGLVAFVALAPLELALLQSADVLLGLPVPAPSPTAYAGGVARVAQAASLLRAGGTASAFLLVAGALLVAFRAARRGAESTTHLVRRALVEKVLDEQPDAALPDAARALTLLDPRPSRGAMTAGPIGFAAAGVAALVTLAGLGELRAGNAHLTHLRSWPEGQRVGADFPLPRAAAGRPLPSGTSLVVSESQVTLGAEHLVTLEGGRLPEGWAGVAGGPAVETGRVLVAADGRVALEALMPLLQAVAVHRSARQFWVVVARAPSDGTAGTAGQAGLELTLDVAPAGAPRVTVRGAEIVLGGETFRPLDHLGRRALQRAVLGALGPSERALGVTVPRAWTIAQLVDELAMLDGACEGPEDCGLPGLGVRVHLRAE